MSETPAVSVLLSTYNGSDFVEQSIASVLSQDLAEFELLIVDDASTDGTFELLGGFCDPRIRLFRNDKNAGLFRNFNMLLQHAHAPLIKLWSQDDVMLPCCLRRGYEFYTDHRDIGCYYCANDSIDEKGANVASPSTDSTPLILPPDVADYYALLHGCLSSNIANLFLPRAMLVEVGAFDPRYIAADFEIMVRIQDRYSIGRIPAILVRVRQHAAQWSLRHDSLLRFAEDDARISKVLFDRAVFRHGVISAHRAHAILRRKFAINYFHAAVRRFFAGDMVTAVHILRAIRGVASPTELALTWITNLPSRVFKRVPKRLTRVT